MIDGKALAAGLNRQLAEIASRLRDQMGFTAGLAAILVGNDPASQVYVRSKRRACEAAGITVLETRLPRSKLALVGSLSAQTINDGA